MKNKLSPVLCVVLFVLLTGFCFTTATRPEPFLKAGNKVVYRIQFATGEKRTSVIEIISVHMKDGAAEVEAHENSYNEKGDPYSQYILKFYYDSLNWYADMLNFMYIHPDKLNGSLDVKSDSVVYPFRMKIGDTLRSAQGTEITKNGSEQSYSQRIMYDRVVTAYDTIETGAGLIAAFRIESKIKMHKSTGKDVLFDCTEWFTPSIGVVKREYNSDLGHSFIVIQSYEY